ncbi:FAD binding domain-containing protein [Panaeolus papilionaceus]|nr:FAD binding domain-containing protein [Panaeolus papilionaceus]
MSLLELNETWVDVLVVGAGPAGLMACNALTKMGLKVHILDKRPQKVVVGQADGLQPRTLESYDLLRRIHEEGNQMHIAAFCNPGPDGGIQLTERVPDVAPSSARYPYQITIHRGVIEEVFANSMRASDVKVDRPVIPVALEVSSDPGVLNDFNAYAIKATVERPGNTAQGTDKTTEIIHSKFVIGADGAHSWVRQQCGIAMEGEQTEDIWGVIDFKVPETNFPDIRNRCMVHSVSGSCMIIPREDEKVRFYILLDEKNVMTNGKVTRKQMLPYQFATPEEFEWFTIYIIGQKVAAKFSFHDRVFIVGDACHTHSPKAGLGMNASMNDSHNLVWKIANVMKGHVKPALLQTYEFERRQYALDLIDFDRNFAKLFSRKPKTEIDMDEVSHEEFFATSAEFTTGIDADVHPVEIQDLLPSDGRFKILIFSGDTTKREVVHKMDHLSAVLKKSLADLVGEDKIPNVFCTLVISSAPTYSSTLNDLPQFLRPHWSRVLIDDIDVQGCAGGGGYAKYGVGPELGAVVVVRPGGYVGTITPLEKPDGFESYISRFIGSK